MTFHWPQVVLIIIFVMRLCFMLASLAQEKQRTPKFRKLGEFLGEIVCQIVLAWLLHEGHFW